MAFTTGKRMTSYPPRPNPELGGGPFFSTGAGGASPKLAAVLTAITGPQAWVGASPTYAYTWYVSGSMAHASATVASYSLSAANTGQYVTCRVLAGNAVWGTNYRDIATGTVIP